MEQGDYRIGHRDKKIQKRDLRRDSREGRAETAETAESRDHGEVTKNQRRLIVKVIDTKA